MCKVHFNGFSSGFKAYTDAKKQKNMTNKISLFVCTKCGLGLLYIHHTMQQKNPKQQKNILCVFVWFY